MLNKIRFLKEKFLEVEKEMLKPEVIADNKKYSELCKEYNELEPISIAYDEYAQIVKSIESDNELLEIETDNEMRSMLNSELDELKTKQEEMDEKIKLLLLPKDENDERNVIIEIRSGAVVKRLVFLVVCYLECTVCTQRANDGVSRCCL